MSMAYEPIATPLAVDTDMVAACWRALVRPGHVHEVRIPKTRRTGPSRFFGVVSGYFDSSEALTSSLVGLSGHDAEGIYLTLNPVNPALLARAANRLNKEGKPVTTADADIVRRRNLFIDIDPVRASGISASNEERAHALESRDTIATFLADEMQWPPPVATLETGNGGGLIYRLKLPNDSSTLHLIERVLHSLATAFSTTDVTVDTTTSNAARIVKIAGTVAAKGDDISDRPWRLATATYAADPMPVSLEQLNAVADLVPPPPTKASASKHGPVSSTYDIPAILHEHGIAFEERARAYGTVYRLDRCLTSDDHNDGAAIFSYPSGAVSYTCHHNRCQGKGWADVRDVLGIGGPAVTAKVTIGGARIIVPPTREEREKRRDEEIAATFPPVPGSAYFGLFNDYRRIMGPTSESPDVFHLGASLTLAGAMIGRRVHAEYASDQLFANLYTVLVGASGSSRKDTAIKRATTLPFWPASLRTISPAFSISRDVSSAEGLIQVLQKHENTLLYLTELSAMIKNARRKGTATILDRLMEAWDTPEVLQNLNKQSPIVAVKPYLSIVAATQPGRLATEMTDEDIHSGFANRWLFLFGAGKPPMARPPAVNRTDAWKIYLELYDAISSYPDGSFLGWDGTANARWDEWYYTVSGLSGVNEDEDAMRVRHATLIQKVALIFAISDRAEAIGDRHLSPAIALIDWMWSILRKLMGTWGVRVDSQIEQAILRRLERCGPMSRRELQRTTSSRKWSGRDFAGAFRSMHENQIVEVSPEGIVSLREEFYV